MSEDNSGTKCGECGRIVDEPPELLPEQRLPCPECGSTKRALFVSVHDTVTAREKLGVSGRHQGEKKPFFEAVSGDDLHRKSGKWMKIERLIDRARNWYREVVTDPESGEIIHKCEEPLTEHRGHGTAKEQQSQESG
jgi:DNA-directed RNA polymerase subunit RPC12/RpoP